jgi:hypothetical protein
MARHWKIGRASGAFFLLRLSLLIRGRDHDSPPHLQVVLYYLYGLINERPHLGRKLNRHVTDGDIGWP